MSVKGQVGLATSVFPLIQYSQFCVFKGCILTPGKEYFKKVLTKITQNLDSSLFLEDDVTIRDMITYYFKQSAMKWKFGICAVGFKNKATDHMPSTANVLCHERIRDSAFHVIMCRPFDQLVYKNGKKTKSLRHTVCPYV